jgi:hypothetical protein
VLEVPDIPDRVDLPQYFVRGTCKKCGKEYIIGTAKLSKEQIIERLKQMPFRKIDSQDMIGECPAGGWHVEKGSMWDNMEFDYKNIYGGIPNVTKL